MESAVVIGMFLEKRRIVIRLHKKKVRIDSNVQKAFHREMVMMTIFDEARAAA